MSLPGLDSGAVLVDHAWEAAAPWQVSCEEGEMVYRVGDDSEDGWVEVQRARDGTRGSVPASYLGCEVVPEAAVVVGSPRSEAAVVVGSLRSPLPDAPDGWLVHSTDQGVLYYKNLVDGHVQWERPTRVASDLPPGAADAGSAPVTPTKAAVARPVASPGASATTPPRAAPPLPPRRSTGAARPLPKPPAPPPRPVAVTPPQQQPAPARDFRAGGKLASAREGASSALASTSRGVRGAGTVMAGHLNPTSKQKEGSIGVAFLRQTDVSKPALTTPTKRYVVHLKDGTLYVLKTESNIAKATIPCRDIAAVTLVPPVEAGGRCHCVKLLLRSVPGSHEGASRIQESLFGGPCVGVLLECASAEEQKAWHTWLGQQKNWGSVQSAAGTGAKGLAACGAIAAGSLAHGFGYGFGRVLGGDAGGGASRSLGLKPRHF